MTRTECLPLWGSSSTNRLRGAHEVPILWAHSVCQIICMNNINVICIVEAYLTKDPENASIRSISSDMLNTFRLGSVIVIGRFNEKLHWLT